VTEPSDSRVALHEWADPGSELAGLYQRVQASMKTIPRMYQALGNSPPLLDGWLAFAWSLRQDSESPAALRELAILRVGRLTGCEYVWRSHRKLALDAGVSEAKVAAAGGGQPWDVFTAEERAVLAVTDALTVHADIPDATWESFAGFFADRQALEIVLTIAWYTCVARVATGLRLPLERWHEQVPGLPAPPAS
jgi:AhpD family alkylhydroperoxidase